MDDAAKPPDDVSGRTHVGVRHAALDGLESLERSIEGAPCEVTQLARGRLRARSVFTLVGRRQVSFGSHDLPLGARGSIAPGYVSIVAVAPGAAPAVYGGQSVPGGALVVFGPGASYDGRAPAGYRWASIHVPCEEFERYVEVATGVELPRPERGTTILKPDARQTAVVDRLVRRSAWEGPAEADGPACHALLDDWMRVVARAVARGTAPRRRERGATTRAEGTLARAEAYLRARLGEPVYVAGVCAAAGVPERTLQALFRRRYGLSPMAYLRVLRLHAVRASLAASRGDPAATVAATARRLGLGSPGRFAREYRDLFGQRPSDTLGRADGDGRSPIGPR